MLLLLESDQAEAVEEAPWVNLLHIVAATTQGGVLPTWASDILRETCGVCFGVPTWLRGEKRFEEINFETFTAKDKDHFAGLIRNVKKVLATEIKLNGAPVWPANLNERRAA